MPRGFLRLETRSRAKEDVKRILTAIDKVRKWEKKWVDVKGCSLKTYKWVPITEPKPNQTTLNKDEALAVGDKRDRFDDEVSDINSSSISLNYNDSFVVEGNEGSIQADDQEPTPKKICPSQDVSKSQVSFTIGSDGESNDSDSENTTNLFVLENKEESASVPASDNENTKEWKFSEDKNMSISNASDCCLQEASADADKSEKEDVNRIIPAESDLDTSYKDIPDPSCKDDAAKMLESYFSSLIAKKLRMPSAAAFQGYETMMNRKSKFIDQLASELMLGRLLMLTEEHNIDHASSLPVIEISSALEAPRDSQFLAEWRQMNRTSLQYKNAKETALRCKLNDKEKFQSSSCIGFESNQIARRNSAKEIETRVYRHPIVIHVYDDANQITKDFICPRELLVKEMQYFAECLPHDISSPDDIDISVHCDIKIFRWLMEYVKSNDKDANSDQSKITEKPKLGIFL
ncbi:uncharacterized protein TRIADDRAFT_59710 [Trichoplax adhaerens]|uniref:SANT and BTB domain-containing protein n=1 Tax=Trichoplax adhaerens TaxID=10228 RepID=B3S681_TRIAD|nr:hypothetical protein TRIADDRAFT_59710 [Trichoplax adhaerens]EDV21711.1 hypothetical protein TRIADDRAFT_59710 [Trichoplax adhaerens]|eukprot:XP_002115859.1 hypothetical protein TRIADDRAFT_59710 [Trichoplax adhaerens]